jgi:AraC-like DNA-binding protein
MRPGGKRRGIPAHWPAQMHHWDHVLSPEAPLHAEAKPPAAYPMSVDLHAGVEVGVVLTGRLEQLWPDRECSRGPGEVWLAGAWEPHAWRIDDPTTTCVVLMFLPDFLGDEMLDGVLCLHLVSVPPEQRPEVRGERLRQEVLSLGRAMQAEVRGERPGWSLAVRLHLLLLLLALRREWEPPTASGPANDVSTSGLARIVPALEAVQRGEGRPPHLAEAAAACGLSVSQFTRVFRTLTGRSFGDFCLRARLATASRLLLATDLTMEAIAERVGFLDGSHLHKRFSRVYGLAPSAYRQHHRQPNAG